MGDMESEAAALEGDSVAAPGGLVGRALVSLAAVIIVLALGRLPLPIDGGLLGLAASQARLVSVGALGVMPFLSGYLVVEWAALVVPPWRRLRHGSRAGRRTLTRVAWALGGLFTVVQAYGITLYLKQLRLPVDGALALADGAALPAGAVLVAGGLACGALAVLVDRRGLGNGWALLLLAPTVADMAGGWIGLARRGGEQLSALAVIIGVGAPLAVVLVTARWLRRPVEVTPGGDGPRVPVPTCGAVPLSLAASLLAFPAAAGAWIPALEPLQEVLRPGGLVYQKAYLVVVAVLAVALPALFSRPALVARGWVRLAGPLAAAEAGQAARQALSRANQRSVLFVVALAALPFLGSALGVTMVIGGAYLATLALAAAVALDLAADARTFAGATPLSALRPIHRVHAVEPALAVLQRAGVPVAVRSRHVRALLHFFGPYAPIELLVPTERAGMAAALVAPILDDDTDLHAGRATLPT